LCAGGVKNAAIGARGVLLGERRHGDGPTQRR
jgi:hypothetical protein